MLTGGHSSTGKPPDDGLVVVFSARDSSGQTISAAGDVAIVVIDPQLEGAASRIARWDFAAVEVASHYRQTGLTRGFHFDLVWPEAAPRHRELKLFVRVTTPEGHRLEAEQAIHVRVAGDSANTWTKAAAPDGWEPATSDNDADEHPAPPPIVANNSAKPRPREAVVDRGAAADESESDPPITAAAHRPAWSPYR